MTSETETLRAALKEAQSVLSQLVNPNFAQSAGHIYFAAVAADAKARAALKTAEREK